MHTILHLVTTVDMRLDIEDCLAQVESCFNLLVPRFDIPDIYSSAESQESSSELSLPPQQGEGTEDVEDDAVREEERKERKRKRTTSSCSFASLSSGDGSNDDESETLSLVHPASEEEKEKSDGSLKDEDILARLYTTSSSIGQGLKIGVTNSASSSKGKGKLKSDMSEEVRGDSKDSGAGGADDNDSDSSSDVEWEDVPILGPSLGSHDQAAELQEHGFTSRGFSIPITIELGNQPEVRETEDNTSIIATLQECKQLLSEKYLPNINKWMEVSEIFNRGAYITIQIDHQESSLTFVSLFFVDSFSWPSKTNICF